MVEQNTKSPVDCACVIHGTGYPWTYVERLYNMLNRHISSDIRFHVYTEASRTVPAHMIKHELEDWGIGGPRRSWWYKLQLFNPAHHRGPMLYFDLDTVIVNNIDWICNLNTNYFWAVQDFKYLWSPNYQGINSSIMWWDTNKFEHVWNNFQTQNLNLVLRRYRGDQDFLNEHVNEASRRYLNPEKIQSWRWQCKDGGYHFPTKTYKKPNVGTIMPADASVLVFHGKPKPAEITDLVVQQHWI